MSLPPPGASAGREPPGSSLWSRLRLIETAFREGDAGALRSSFTQGGKLRLDVPQVPGSPASYGAGQLQVIFAQLFRRAPTDSFAFGPDDVSRPSDDTAFARARWRRRGSLEQPEPPEALTFTLRIESGDWRIYEILAPR